MKQPWPTVSFNTYHDVPGLAQLTEFFYLFISMAFLFVIAREMQVLIREKRCDFMTPTFRAGCAVWFLKTLPDIGDFLRGQIASLVVVLGQDINAQRWGALYKKFSTIAQGDVLSGAAGTLIGLPNMLLMTLAQWLAKLLVIDILWPAILGMWLVLGVLSCTVGLLPNVNSFGKWGKGLIILCLWPICHVFSAALLTSQFESLLTTFDELDLKSFYESASSLYEVATTKKTLDEWLSQTTLIALLRYEALCVVQILFTFASPWFARHIVNDGDVGLAGGMLASQIFHLGTAGAGRAASALRLGSFVNRFGNGSALQRGMSAAAGATSGLRGSSVVDAVSGSRDINRRPRAHFRRRSGQNQ